MEKKKSLIKDIKALFFIKEFRQIQWIDYKI
jgi:hypothetical protein